MTRQMQSDLNREFEASDATAQDVLDMETWLKQANLWPWHRLPASDTDRRNPHGLVGRHHVRRHSVPARRGHQ